jgi:hypothetical protein
MAQFIIQKRLSVIFFSLFLKSSALENIDLNTSVLTSPTIGLQHDWVLVLDETGLNFPAPGSGNYYDEEHTNKKQK